MNQQQQQWHHRQEQGWAWLEQQRRLQEREPQYGALNPGAYPMPRSALAAFFKGLFVLVLVLTLLAGLALGAFVILGKLGVIG